MSESDKITRQLARKGKVDPSAGSNAAWAAIAEANRIFGPHGWTREFLEMRNAANREREGMMTCAYVARVRITVFGPSGPITRDSHGCGEGRGLTAFEAHDHGLKAAELDATLRAFATFGKVFGLGDIITASGSNRRKGRAATQKSNASESGKSVQACDAEADGEARPFDASPAEADAERKGEPEADAPLPAAKSPLLLPKSTRRRSPAHLAHVRAQPCLVCGRSPADAHHLRFVGPRAMGRKVSDEYTVPLCRRHHDLLHRDPSEVEWWASMGIEPLAIAEELWRESQGGQSAILEEATA